MIPVAIGSWLTLMLVTAPPPGGFPADRSLVVQTTVVQSPRESSVVAFGSGIGAGVGVGDLFWVLDGTRVVGGGTIFLAGKDGSAGRWVGTAGGTVKGLTAVIVRQAGLGEARDMLPDGVTLRGRVMRLPPGRQTAWLDLGSQAGLRLNDMLLVSRRGIPVARGQVTGLEERSALAALRPVVGNALPQEGDTVELWPAPAERRQGRLNSVVLEARPDPKGNGLFVRFVGSSADGVVANRLVDLYRHDAYVGAAVIVDALDPISRAQMIESASMLPPDECDVVVVRPAPPDQPIRAAIFKVLEGNDYCLLAAGESDGVQVGEEFVVYRSDPENPSRRQEVAELTISATQFYHSEATVRMRDAGGGSLRQWDFAERRTPPWMRWGAIGLIKRVDAAGRWAAADIDPRCKPRVGQVVRCSPTADAVSGSATGENVAGAAVILGVSSDEVVLHVPSAWGDPKHLDHARVEVSMTTLDRSD
ncbi:MAG TPA: hypothetical protein VLM89_08015 [Phycisphaerae bacterium]|nr:hypothetical protein [Phycisphaerae bacterium]